MIEIFIPVLFMCFNGYCNFMQAQSYYTIEERCRDSVDKQKIHLTEIAEKSNQGKVEVLEGTCINAKIQNPKGKNDTAKL